MLKEILPQNLVFIELQLTELDKLMFVVTELPWNKDKYTFHFDHCVYIPILN